MARSTEEALTKEAAVRSPEAPAALWLPAVPAFPRYIIARDGCSMGDARGLQKPAAGPNRTVSCPNKHRTEMLGLRVVFKSSNP